MKGGIFSVLLPVVVFLLVSCSSLRPIRGRNLFFVLVTFISASHGICPFSFVLSNDLEIVESIGFRLIDVYKRQLYSSVV